eukprot:PLAT9089.1.p1 GENE.PLAT9089.1~~PLAT9089.1.p1  ORF type:complete len:909 (+),score=480.31 PLAT9089.1:85-2811(+)
MGACNSAMSAEERASRAVMEQQREDALKEAAKVKILFLGTGESGKSTTIRQLRMMYGRELSVEERMSLAPLLGKCALVSMSHLLSHAGSLVEDRNAEAKDELLELASSSSRPTLTPRGAELIAQLWKDSGVQRAYSTRSSFQLDDSASYYFEHAARFASGFTPTDEDMLRLRVKTTGVREEQLDVDGTEFHVYDVGGQRNERRKWMYHFDNVTVLVYVVSMSEYDLGLYEDDGCNRMQESLTLWHDMVNNKCFRDTSIVLLFNKYDIFKQKIRVSPINGPGRFEDYTAGTCSCVGEDCVCGVRQVATQYIVRRYLSQNENKKKRVLPFLATATAGEGVKQMFEAIRGLVLQGLTVEDGLATLLGDGDDCSDVDWAHASDYRGKLLAGIPPQPQDISLHALLADKLFDTVPHRAAGVEEAKGGDAAADRSTALLPAFAAAVCHAEDGDEGMFLCLPLDSKVHARPKLKLAIAIDLSPAACAPFAGSLDRTTRLLALQYALRSMLSATLTDSDELALYIHAEGSGGDAGGSGDGDGAGADGSDVADAASSTLLPLSPVAECREDVEAALACLTATGGGSDWAVAAWSDALTRLLAEAEEDEEEDDRHVVRRLLVITDKRPAEQEQVTALLSACHSCKMALSVLTLSQTLSLASAAAVCAATDATVLAVHSRRALVAALTTGADALLLPVARAASLHFSSDSLEVARVLALPPGGAATVPSGLHADGAVSADDVALVEAAAGEGDDAAPALVRLPTIFAAAHGTPFQQRGNMLLLQLRSKAAAADGSAEREAAARLTAAVELRWTTVTGEAASFAADLDLTSESGGFEELFECSAARKAVAYVRFWQLLQRVTAAAAATGDDCSLAAAVGDDSALADFASARCAFLEQEALLLNDAALQQDVNDVYAALGL